MIRKLCQPKAGVTTGKTDDSYLQIWRKDIYSFKAE
jgi:hypothetical protein